MQIAPPPSSTPIWDRLRATFDRVIAAVGAPAAIALLSLSTRHARYNIVRQLLTLESLVRRLLLAEAAALAPPEAERGPRLITIPIRAPGLVTPLNHAPRHPPCRTLRPIDPERPETWNAQFALSLPRDLGTPSDRSAPRIRALWGNSAPPAPLPPSAPRTRRPASFLLARRFEAIRRVLNDPAPHARRLALAQRRATARSPSVARRYALASPRRPSYDPYDERLGIDILSLALIAREAFSDTS